jgi:hypothetical protein
MKILNQITLACLVIAGLSMTSCDKENEIAGCTDPSALNYNANATISDGSCEYPLQCEINGTGEVYFINHSNSNSTYDIIWDGVKIATVTPNQSSNVFTFSANVQHTLVFRYTNTSNNACTPSTPYLTQCAQLWFDCSQ